MDLNLIKPLFPASFHCQLLSALVMSNLKSKTFFGSRVELNGSFLERRGDGTLKGIESERKRERDSKTLTDFVMDRWERWAPGWMAESPFA